MENKEFLDKVYAGRLSETKKAQYEEYLNHLSKKERPKEPGNKVNVRR